MRKESKIYWWVVAACLIYVAVFILASCSPYKRLQDRKPKNEKEKSMLASACVENFPSKTDTLTEYISDTVEIENTEGITELNKLIDSLLIEQAKIIKDTAIIEELKQRLHEALIEDCPPAKVVTKTVITTITKPDKAKEFLLEQKIKDLENKYLIVENERNQLAKIKENIERKQETSISYNLLNAAKALWHKWWWYLILGIFVIFVGLKINPFPLIKTLFLKFKK